MVTTPEEKLSLRGLLNDLVTDGRIAQADAEGVRAKAQQKQTVSYTHLTLPTIRMV